MKRISWLLVLLTLLLGTSGNSIAQPAKRTLLKNVDVITSGDSTRIELRFNGMPHENGIIYKDNFLQVEFPETYMNPPKQWIKVEDNLVKNIFAYQFDATTVKVRFFTTGKAKDLKDKINFSKEHNKIIVQYHILSGSSGASAISGIQEKSPPPPPSQAPTLEGGAKQEHEHNDEPTSPPSATVPQSIPKDKMLIPTGAGSPDIYASLLKMVLALGILLSLLFIGLFLFKRLLGKKIGMTDKNQSIRVITSAYIGPKKSIALVDISGERIVVGITPDHISMLTRVSKDAEFKDVLKEQISSNDNVELHDELWEKA